MIVYLLIIILIFSIYLSTFQFFISGWKKLPQHLPEYFDGTNISVIVPVRNEEKNMNQVINDLLNQDYSLDYYKIIIVDDHSSDLTLSFARRQSEKNSIISVYELPAKKHGKKAAINMGIESSESEVIVTTDADCRLGKSWLSNIITYYMKEKKPKLLIGLVDYSNVKGIFSIFQNLDFLSMVGSGAGAAGKNRPFLCNGANLVYQKSVYTSLSDPLQENIPSGDDVLFLFKIKKICRDEIKVIKSNNAIVYTKPSESLREFIDQRIRWASKSKFYRDIDMIYVSVLIMLVNMMLLCNYFLAIFNVSWYPFAISLFIKIVSDLLFLKPVLKFFKKSFLLFYVIPFQFIYPFYIVIIWILSLFINSKWKGIRIQK